MRRFYNIYNCSILRFKRASRHLVLFQVLEYFIGINSIYNSVIPKLLDFEFLPKQFPQNSKIIV